MADTHVHLYPCYDLRAAFRNMLDNSEKFGTNTVRTAFLAERADCRYFADISDGKKGIGIEGLDVEPSAEKGALMLREGDGRRLYLFAGRQISTAERIEILALTTDVSVDDGHPARQVVRTVLDAGGIPVVSWAPGKWFFRRGKTVRDLIDEFSPGRLLVGDTGLRPAVWPEPSLMRLARRKGFAVVAGSDPLPFPGEEKYVGTYVSVIHGILDPHRPVTSARKVLTSPDAVIARTGRRCGLLETIYRLKRNAAVGKQKKARE